MKTVGIIGGGQLAHMLALAGYPLGIKCICLENTADCPAGLVTDVVVGDYTDKEKLQQLAYNADVITYEFENIDWQALHKAVKHKAIYPPLPALQFSQDRVIEKTFFNRLGIPTARYNAAKDLTELNQVVTEIGLPVVIKTRRFGYDGKGQFLVRNKHEIAQVWSQLQGQALIVEAVVKFEREVSMIAVRNVSGEIVYYPLIENQHSDGILRVSKFPFIDEKLQHQAEQYANAVLKELNYVGVLAIEFFQHGEQLLANEMAPRVHNSGHLTIEGAATSQFENHLRAILDLPLGDTGAVGYSAMVNIIGEMPAAETILKIPGAHFYDYGKKARSKRKLGHITVCANDAKTLGERCVWLQKSLQEHMQFSFNINDEE